MKPNLNCPSCGEKGIYHRFWLYAGWPLSTRCTLCDVRLRSRTTGWTSNMVQIVMGLLIVLAYTSGNTLIYLYCLGAGLLMLFFLPYFGTYEVIE